MASNPHAPFMPKLMILDDDRAFCREMADFFRSFGFLPKFCDNPALAQRKALLAHPDIVLLDLHMPGFDSLAIGQAIKRQQPWVQLIYTVTNADAALAEKALASGGESILFKPFRNMHIVYQTVRQSAATVKAWQESMLRNLKTSFPGEYETIFGPSQDVGPHDDMLEAFFSTDAE